MVSNIVRLSVAAVALDGESEAPSVLLRDVADGTILSIPVGAFEASAIIIEVEKIRPPQPLTHDLLAEFFNRHGFKLDRFELYSCDLDGFYGRLRYRKGLHRYSMEVRPSDGIALALRLQAPITATRELAAMSALPVSNPKDAFFVSDSVLLLDAEECAARA